MSLGAYCRTQFHSVQIFFIVSEIVEDIRKEASWDDGNIVFGSLLSTHASLLSQRLILKNQ